MSDDLAVVHGHEPIEALRFVHIGRRHHHAHLRASRPDRVDEVPELPPRQRVDAGRGLVQDEQIRIVDERTAKTELLLHSAGELTGRAILERIKRGGGQEFGDAGAALGSRLSEQPAEEVDILENAERRIEIAAEPLRHVGNAGAEAFEVGRLGKVAVEHHNLSALDCAHARNQGQQGGLADPVGSDHPHHLARRDFNRCIVERDRRPVTVRDVLEPGDDFLRHCGSLT